MENSFLNSLLPSAESKHSSLTSNQSQTTNNVKSSPAVASLLSNPWFLAFICTASICVCIFIAFAVTLTVLCRRLLRYRADATESSSIHNSLSVHVPRIDSVYVDQSTTTKHDETTVSMIIHNGNLKKKIDTAAKTNSMYSNAAYMCNDMLQLNCDTTFDEDVYAVPHSHEGSNSNPLQNNLSFF